MTADHHDRELWERISSPVDLSSGSGFHQWQP